MHRGTSLGRCRYLRTSRQDAQRPNHELVALEGSTLRSSLGPPSWICMAATPALHTASEVDAVPQQ